jgi:hypothetical protein
VALSVLAMTAAAVVNSEAGIELARRCLA